MARLSQHTRWIPGGVLLVLSALCALMSNEMNRHFRAEQRIELQVATQHVERRLATCIQDRVSLLANDAESWELRPIRDRETFERFSARTQERFPGFQALNWIDPAGVVRWVVPLAGNEGAVGLDISAHPVATVAFALARETREPAVTPPLNLAQGGTGFAAYVPLIRDGQIEGYLNGVFRTQAVVDFCLRGAPVDRVAIELAWEDRPVARFGRNEPETGTVLKWRLPVGVHAWPGRAWLAPSLQARAFWIHTLPLLVGLVLALATSGGVWWALRRQAVAQAANARARVLLENAPEGIVVYEPGPGRVVELNAPARRMLGADATAVAALLGGPGGLPAVHFERALAGQTQVLEHVFPLPEGAVPFEIRVVGLPGGAEGQVFLSLIDIRERRRATQERERLLGVLTAQAAQLEEVVYSVAHDLRSPLVGIGGHAGFTREALGAAATDDVQEALSGIERQVDLLDRKLGGLGRLADLGRRPLEIETVDAAQVLAGVVEALGLPTPTLTVQVESPLPTCLADAHLLRVVFRELLDNARRHAAPAGEPRRITVSGARVPEGVQYAVVDDGPGMSEDERTRTRGLFRGARGGIAGSGMGLAVAERAMTRMGGRLVLGVAVGGGTRVCITLPAA